MSPKKRYVIVGCGGRSWMYAEALVKDYATNSELVAVCDNNLGRMRLYSDWAAEHGITLKTFLDYEFERMITEIQPDIVIVTCKDAAHDGYIVRSMELGCDVITEKPMTIDEYKCQNILDTQKKTGRSCRVTFNYRYSPPRTQIKELLMSGVIGEVLSVDFHWLLDTVHGADYFRRWHSNRQNSGGLQVHKATHHFDLINWWLSSVPESVFATGGRVFYTPATADRYGLTQRGERCLDCLESKRCPFFLDVRAYPEMKRLYLENEHFDGYWRDRCVFHPAIDIQDTLHAVVEYRSGVQMNYSLHAFIPWEGHIVSFNGSKGRLEHVCRETCYFSGDGSLPGELIPEGTSTKIFPHFLPGYAVDIWRSEGSHGGGDAVLLEDLFAEHRQKDKYLRAADQRGGAWSILTGVAVSRSLEWGKPVRIDELVRGLGKPDYPPMPSAHESLEAVLDQPRKGKYLTGI